MSADTEQNKMISLRFSDIVHEPKHLLLCGIPVMIFISPQNACNVFVRLSCLHAFEDSRSTDVEIMPGQTYLFEYKDKKEELRIGRQFTIIDAE